mmetsp:Transcript_9936/g.10041  ORF Transcript_9936/g.10041 Transcript_9936/m.10041 type:complete len:462 (-) Transcript_9936:86-1471(-)|eukprot:CAMPEP_0182424266 /NCGR_PEP_ID=MMETSP1167-20130531/10441_1 /TAXON_ID=2988 /ORGANISM="Mallomonas Sp, Strain CCMP3275" /LENGTH=461 /DNA_ID=CAMNT_0024603933 /DNA_START=142 /DNA_END=1527 /DNA_ORIENTATION=-
MAGFDERLCETFTAPTNIAVIKYWGKDNVKLNTPMNSSFSVTLDQKDLHTITTIAASLSFPSDRFWLNGKEIEINSRAKTCLAAIRALAQDKYDPKTKEILVKKEDWPKYGLHISSLNTFPTGAGLASSAAGLACFVTTLARLYNVQERYVGEVSGIARQGSGSASRSMYGGFVRWEKGKAADGSDSIAVQLAGHEHWPQLRAVVLVVSEREKDTSSTQGMETSRLTSPLLSHRARAIVPDRLQEMEQAVQERDFQAFARLTMQDSNQFHAVCQDTYPPIRYMNDVSWSIIRLVHVLNEEKGKCVAAYTYDAGPNAVIYTLEEYLPLVTAVMHLYFPPPPSLPLSLYCNDATLYSKCVSTSLSPSLVQRLDTTGRKAVAGDVKHVFLTGPGPGPLSQPFSESLLNLQTGLPQPASSKHKRLQIASVSTGCGGGREKSWWIGLILGGCAISATVGFLLAKKM